MAQAPPLLYGVLDELLLNTFNYNFGLFQEELGAEMKNAALSITNLSPENVVLKLRICMTGEDFAKQAKEQIDNIKVQLVNNAEQNGFKLEVKDSVDDKNLDIELKVNNLLETWIGKIKESEKSYSY